MSLTLAPPPPSFASPPSRHPVAGAAASSAAAASRPPTSRLRVSCRAACRAPPSPSIAEFEPLPRRGGRPSLYEILRVRENASAREIKAAYRALAKSHHPDAAGHSAGPDGRDFIQIHDAYETLSDPAARAVYDLSLGGSAAATGSRRRPARGGAGGGWAGFCQTRRWETDQCW